MEPSETFPEEMRVSTTLAQDLNDVSRSPFQSERISLQDMQVSGVDFPDDLLIVTGIEGEYSLPIIDHDISDDLSSIKGKLITAETGDSFTPGEVGEKRASWLLVNNVGGDTASLQPGDRVILDYGAEYQHVVYLPQVSLSPGQYISFWIAEDGSTYYAHSPEEEGGVLVFSVFSGTENSCDQDAAYACTYGEDSLAQAAMPIHSGSNSAGNSNLLVWGGGAPERSPELAHGRFNTGVSFDGFDDLVRCGSWSALTSFSVEAWVKITEDDRSGVIFAYASEDLTSACELYLQNGTPKFMGHLGNSTFTFSSDLEVEKGAWTHLAGTYSDIEGPKVYVNGLCSENSVTEEGVIPIAGIWLGYGWNVYSKFGGLIDEVRFSDTVVDVNSNWLNGIYDSPLDAAGNTIALWHFDGSPAIDMGDAESYDYGTTASNGSPDMQKPDVGYHHFGERFYDDDGVDFQFSWDSPASDGTCLKYKVQIDKRDEATPVCTWCEIEEDGTLNAYDALGSALPDGDYLFTIGAFDGADVLKAAKECSITVDTQAPQESYLVLLDNDEEELTHDHIKANEGVLEEIVYGEDARQIVLEAHFGIESNPWKVKFGPGFGMTEPVIVDEAPYQFVYRLAQGVSYDTEQLEIIFYDGAGNSELVTVDVTYSQGYFDEVESPNLYVHFPDCFLDDSLEQIDDDMPGEEGYGYWDQDEGIIGSGGIYLSVREEVQLGFLAEDAGSKLRKVSLFFDNRLLSEVETDAVTQKTLSFMLNTGTISDGLHLLTCEAVDWAGNTTTEARYVKIVPGPLNSVAIECSDSLPIVYSGQGEITVGFEAVGYDRNGKRIVMSDCSSVWRVDGNIEEDGDGYPFTLSYVISQVKDYSVDVQVTQEYYLNGNCADCDIITIGGALNVPVVSVHDVARVEVFPSNVLLGREGSQQFSATAYDYGDNVYTGSGFEWSVAGEAGGSIDPQGGFYHAPATGVSDGHSVQIEARIENAAGSGSVSGFGVVQFDVLAPTVNILSPAEGGTVSGTAVAVEWTTEDLTTYTYELILDDKMTLAKSEGIASMGWLENEIWDTTIAANGYHNLTVRAVDSVGNVGSDSVTVLVDNGSDSEEECIASGVNWLLRHQKVMGFWDEQSAIAGTSLLVRALSESGDVPELQDDKKFFESRLGGLEAKKAAYALISGLSDAPDNPEDPPKYSSLFSSVGDLEIDVVALACLGMACEPYSGTNHAAAELLSRLPDLDSSESLGLALFALQRSGQTVTADDIEALCLQQQADGSWGRVGVTAWALLALEEWDPNITEAFFAVEFLQSYAAERVYSNRENEPLASVALAYWALSNFSGDLMPEQRIIEYLRLYLMGKRMPLNVALDAPTPVATEPSGGWSNFGNDYAETTVVLKTLLALLNGPEGAAVRESLVRSNLWLESGADSRKEESLEHLSRYIETRIGLYSNLTPGAESLDAGEILSQIISKQLTGGGFPERSSVLSKQPSNIDSAISLANLDDLSLENRTVLTNALQFLAQTRIQDVAQAERGWPLSGNVSYLSAGTEDLYTTCLALIGLRQIRESGAGSPDSEVFDSPITNGCAWVAGRQGMDLDGNVLGNASFNNDVVDTALAYLALLDHKGTFDRDGAKDYLMESQNLENGSWNDRPLDTALAMLALHYRQSPDLEMFDLTADVNEQNEVDLTFTVLNQSTLTDCYGPIEVALYDADPDDPESGALRLGVVHSFNADFVSGPHVEPYPTLTASLSDFAYTPPPGKQKIYVKVDPGDRIVEEDETNNTGSVDLLLLTTTDLVAYDDELQISSDCNFISKGTVTLGGYFFNEGRIPPAIPFSYNIAFPNLYGVQAAADVQPDGYRYTYEIGAVEAFFSDGQYPLSLWVDRNDVIDEAYEDNNIAQALLVVDPAEGSLGCDLVIDKIFFEQEEIWEDQLTTLHIRVRNIGGQISKPSGTVATIKILDNGSQIGDREFLLTHPSTGISPSDFAFLTMDVVLSPGKHDLAFTVDASEQISNEFRENNTVIKQVYIHPNSMGSDFNIGFTSEDLFYDGDSLQVTVHNYGGKPADQNVNLEIYRDSEEESTPIASQSLPFSSSNLAGRDKYILSVPIPVPADDLVHELRAVLVNPETASGQKEPAGADLDNAASIWVSGTGANADAKLVNVYEDIDSDGAISDEPVSLYAIFEEAKGNGCENDIYGDIIVYDKTDKRYLRGWGCFPLSDDDKYSIIHVNDYLSSGNHDIQYIVDGLTSIADPTASKIADMVPDNNDNLVGGEWNTLPISVKQQGHLPDLVVEHDGFGAGGNDDLRLIIDPADNSIIVSAVIHNLDNEGKTGWSDTAFDVPVYFQTDGTDVMTYQVTIDRFPAGKDVCIQRDTNCTFSELAENNTSMITVIVDAAGAIGERDDTNNCATIPVANDAVPPTGLDAFPGDRQAQIVWFAPAEDEMLHDDIAGYWVYYEQTNKLDSSGLNAEHREMFVPKTDCEVGEEEHTEEALLTGLDNMIEYTVAVSTLSTSGLESEMCPPATFLPMAKPIITHVNGEEVTSSQPYYVNSDPISVCVMSSPNTQVVLYCNGKEVGLMRAREDGVCLFTDEGTPSENEDAIDIDTTENCPNILTAIALKSDDLEGREYSSKSSDPINVVFNNSVDLAISREDVVFRALDGRELSTWEVPDYVGETVLVELTIHNLGGGTSASGGSCVYFTFCYDGEDEETASWTESGVSIPGRDSATVVTHWAIPYRVVKSLTVQVHGELDNDINNNIAFVPLNIGGGTNYGKDFWVANTYGCTIEDGSILFEDGKLYIYSKPESGPFDITFSPALSSTDPSETITGLQSGVPHEFTIPISRFGIRRNDFTATGLHEQTDYNYGIHISSSEDVSVVFYNPTDMIQDGYLTLPSNLLSKYYYVGTYYDDIQQSLAWTAVSIIAVEASGTNITIYRPDGNVLCEKTGLEYGDVYSIFAQEDIAGCVVRSNMRIAVISGAEAVNIPGNKGYADSLCSYQTPIEQCGREFATVPWPCNNPDENNDLIRVVGAPGTELIIDGTSRQIPATGFVEYPSPVDPVEPARPGEPHYIKSVDPVSVFQFAKARTLTGDLGDPNMSIIYPISRY